MSAGPVLPIADDDLVSCVACGLCLPHCPTYRVTQLEVASPRGRIAAMRAVQSGAAPLDATFERYMEECVQCRGCEAACPSGVPFGRLMEGAREALHEHRRSSRPRIRRLGEWLGFRVVLPRHAVVVATSWVAGVAQRLRLVPRRAGLPRISLRELARPMRPTASGALGPDAPRVVLFTGCVMDAWMRGTHRAAQRVVEACGARVELPGRGADCCGALHVHAGRVGEARRLAARVIDAIPGDAPVVVDSAGCGAMMKDYARLLGTPRAAAFSARVRDLAEWIDEQGPAPVRATGQTVVVQDPCHLRHVQRSTLPTRRVVGAAYELRETDDDGLCCGAGGAYSVLQPELSLAVRDRKVAALRRAAGDGPCVVVSANPGCLAHLQAGGVDARHTADLLARALDGTRALDRPASPDRSEIPGAIHTPDGGQA